MLMIILMLFWQYLTYANCGDIEENKIHRSKTKEINWDQVDNNLPKNGELFEGDILMDGRLRQIVRNAKSKKSALVYYGFLDARWPNGIVYYEIGHSFVPWNRLFLKKVIRQFETRTCIRFKRRRYERNYVVFSSKENSCFSNVGMMGGRQIINLSGACARLGTFEHEIMHALGIVHEQSRPDRDDYIKINVENIKQEDLGNFAKYRYYEIDNLKEQFNFASIMLYPNYAFSKNGRRTLQAIHEPYLRFGQREQFSVGDVKQINRLYRCHRPLDSPDYTGLVKDLHVDGKISFQPHSGYLGQFERIMMTIQNFLEDLHLTFVF